MEKLLYFAFVLSPSVLFAFLRVPETPTPKPTLTLAAQPSCQVATANATYETSLGAASEQLEQFASSPADVPRKLDR